MSQDQPLPIVLRETAGQRFDCHSCTRCCRELVVHLTLADKERLDARSWSDSLGAVPYVRLGGAWVLNKRDDGRCVFLEEDGKCRIHREHGFEAKPFACRMYPFTLVPGERKQRMSWRFDCPTIARSEGRPVVQHERVVRRLAGSGEFTPAAPSAAPDARAETEATVATAIVRVCESWLAREGRPLAERLRPFVALVDILADPAFGMIDGEDLVQLVVSLGGSLGEARAVDPAPPTPRQRGFLRLAAFTHCEHLSLKDALSAWRRFSSRFGQLSKARRLRRGTGAIPALFAGAGPVTSEQVEAVTYAVADSQRVEELLTRYFRVALASHGFYGKAYYGWNVREGLAALALRLPILGWLARYEAAAMARSTAGFDDVAGPLARVDQAAGRLRSLGTTAERLRLKYLLRDHGLPRLLRAYPLGVATDGSD